MSRPRTIRLVRLVVDDDDVQPRVELDDDAIDDYAAAMREAGGWGDFPPLEAVDVDGRLLLVSGFHRHAAASLAGLRDAPCIVAQGAHAAAVWAAVGANRTNSVRLTSADKRKAARLVLLSDGGTQRSDRSIAQHIGCSAATVAKVRRKLLSDGHIRPAGVRRGADGRVRPTAQNEQLSRQSGVTKGSRPTAQNEQLRPQSAGRRVVTDGFDQSAEQYAGGPGDITIGDVFGDPVEAVPSFCSGCGQDERQCECGAQLPDVAGEDLPPWEGEHDSRGRVRGTSYHVTSPPSLAVHGVPIAPEHQARLDDLRRLAVEAEQALRRLYAEADLLRDELPGEAGAAAREIFDRTEALVAGVAKTREGIPEPAAQPPRISSSPDPDPDPAGAPARVHTREGDEPASEMRVAFAFWTLLDRAAPPPEQWLPDGLRIDGGVFTIETAPTEADVRAMFKAALVPAAASVPGAARGHIYSAVSESGLRAALAAIYRQALTRRDGMGLSRRAQYLPTDAAEVRRRGYSIEASSSRSSSAGRGSLVADRAAYDRAAAERMAQKKAARELARQGVR